MSDPATPNGRSVDGPTLTVRTTAIIGADVPPTPDPTEDYHEASRTHPSVADPLVVGAMRLERSAELRVSVARSVKRHEHRPFTVLPRASLGDARLQDVLRARRSRRAYADASLSLAELAALLRSAYGPTSHAGGEQSFRSAPSGGALFPLELYVASLRVDALERALYHYDPLHDRIELLRPLAVSERVGDLTPYPELVEECAAFVVLTAMFWRSRFKYGARAYRFTLLEAGHVAQNFLLAAEALGLASTPVGGFFDRRVEDFTGVDGLYEAPLYLLPVGRLL